MAARSDARSVQVPLAGWLDTLTVKVWLMLSVDPPWRFHRLNTWPFGPIRSTTRSPMKVCWMCTSTVEVELALPVQPEIVIWLEPVPRSGIVASVPLVTAGQLFGGGGGAAPGLVNSRRFGEPEPALPILFGVELLINVEAT